ncbi:MAG: DUF1800 domain-containing protein [Gammaproteobacteria bacterium]|nr:MAG: DUF1800 domain-containing protein [Gammaproteobacteria bacterium]
MATMTRRRMMESGLAALVSSMSAGAGAGLAQGMNPARLRERSGTPPTPRVLRQPGKPGFEIGHIPMPAGFIDNAALKLNLPPAPEIVQLLNRISYGFLQEELDAAEAMGYAAWVEYQLNYEDIDASELEDILNEFLPTLTMSNAELFELEDFGQAYIELKAATLFRQIFSPRQLFERMVEFWGDHFNIYHQDDVTQILKTSDDRDVIRPNALGSFRDMLFASASSAAMVYYLDNFSNTVFGPQENYGRELMELHTLGVDGPYTEEDVIEVARAFTGWTLTDETDDLFTFYAPFHDFEEKVVLGQVIPAGGGIEDGEFVLDLLADHESTANYLAKKLCIRFVADDPPQSIIDKIAQEYLDTGGDIREMMRTLLLSGEFRNNDALKFKRPTDYLMSVIRTLNPNLTDAYFRLIFDFLITLGHLPFQWPTPDGYPDDAVYWTSTNALLNRWNFAIGAADGGLDYFIQVRIFELMDGARRPIEIVDTLAERILHRDLAADDRAVLLEYASDGGSPNQWLPLAEAVRKARGVVALLLSSRYFQNR